MLLSDFIRTSVKTLSSLYEAEEARSMVMYYCSEVLGFPVYQHITEPKTEIPEELAGRVQADMERLAASEPLQYVLGYTEFCGRNFAVDARALIPRAETEMLCIKAGEMVAGTSEPEDASAPLRILDLCTGSGCIAWTLALDLPGAEVIATDLSSEALDLARSQFGKRGAVPGWTGRLPKHVAAPHFVQADVLDVEVTLAAATGRFKQTDSHFAGFDLLTANPPYVMPREKEEMRPNVLDWEPHMAIFAPDLDPLAFHKAIALIARRALVPGGHGIVEINSELPEETAEVFRRAGLFEVQIVPDFFDRPRFVAFSLAASSRAGE